VRRKGSSLTDSKSAMLLSETHENQSIEAPKLLAIEGFQEEKGEYESLSEDDDDGDNDQSEDVVYVETKPDENANSKKRKASKKLKSPRFVSSHFLTVSACKLTDLSSCMGFIFL
jgi:coilin